jgi:intein/homing endonuclease
MQFKINGPPQPFDSLGLFTLLRTYSRRVKEDDANSPVETWEQILTRCINACNTQLKCNFTQEEAQEFFDLLYNRKGSLAGRFLWQLGTKTVDKLGLMSLQNCAFCVIDTYKSFTWIMNFLMLGAGCGYRILQEDIDKFPLVQSAHIVRRDEKDSDFIVPDSRQGWVKLLGKTLKAHFYSGQGFTYSTHLLRSKGAPIKSFGGLSSGPEVLCDGIAKISELLNKRFENGGKLTTTDALDIANIIGMIVVSGNVRRCLPKGSLVHVKGNMFKKIEDMKIGDEVLTSDGYHTVKNVFYQGEQNIVKIITKDGIFRCTANHKMASRNMTSTNDIVWKQAILLTSSDYILSLLHNENTRYSDLNMDQVIDVVPDGRNETWDIEVEEKHEFFCNSYLTHNSAQIALGDVKDTEFLRAKRWDLGMIPNWRCYSNNSVICNDINDVLENDEFWCGYQGNGEPYGLINLKLAQACGRLGEMQYADPEVEGVNPCVSGDTLVLTDKGEIPVIDLVGKGKITLLIDGENHDTSETGFFKTSDARLLCRIYTKSGKNLRATADHKLLCQTKGWTEISNIQIGDFIRVNSDSQIIDETKVWEEVELIDADVHEPVYDCTVPTTHCFSANGILAHNCSEQSLARWETCCLGEIYLPNITSFEELKKTATYIYRACKHSLSLPCIDSKETEDIVHKNMRMGIGYTGILQATDEQRFWISPCYEYLRDFDKTYSEKNNFPPSIKLQTVKPSGCSRGDSLILTTKGLQRLDELGDIKGESWQDVKGIQAFTDAERTENITKFYVNGKVETRKITTQDGLEVESSLNHQYRVLDENGNYTWRQVQDLKVGDRFVVKLGGHPTGITTYLKKCELKENTSCQIMTQPDILTTDIAWFLGLFYGDGSVHKKGIRISFNRKQPDLLIWLRHFFENTFSLKTTIDDDHSFYINSQQFLQWLEENECMKDYAHELCVPKFIRYSSAENVEAFVDGFWRADGGIHSDMNTWSVCTVSEKFAKEMFQLFRSIGFNVCISVAGPGGLGSKDRWIIRVRHMCESKKRYFSKEFKSRIWNNYWLDPIVSITPSECETYDIEVENAHHYRLGGVISHNTLSLLGGCTAGIHPGYSRYYIRRIRVSSESKLIQLAKDHGYHVEFVQNFDGTLDYNTQVISFPYCLPEHTILAENMTAIQQLEWVKWAQTNLSDNAVSVTVYYRKEELADIKAWLKEHYNNSVKAVSFLLHSEHGFKQAPLEKISKEEYEEMMKVCKPIVDVGSICYSVSDEKFIAEGECVGGACPLK